MTKKPLFQQGFTEEGDLVTPESTEAELRHFPGVAVPPELEEPSEVDTPSASSFGVDDRHHEPEPEDTGKNRQDHLDQVRLGDTENQE